MAASEETVNALRAALSVSPDNIPLRQHLAATLLGLGRYADAESEYRQALEAMLLIKGPVDLFFDQVMVMAEDRQQRQNRLNLLTALRAMILEVGDISRIHAED